jgi:hypothetical protein
MKQLRCDTHGTATWRGHVICAKDAGGCGRVFQTSEMMKPLFAPYNCECGQPLMSSPPMSAGRFAAHLRRDTFTARAICAACFDERAKGQVS